MLNFLLLQMRWSSVCKLASKHKKLKPWADKKLQALLWIGGNVIASLDDLVSVIARDCSPEPSQVQCAYLSMREIGEEWKEAGCSLRSLQMLNGVPSLNFSEFYCTYVTQVTQGIVWIMTRWLWHMPRLCLWCLLLARQCCHKSHCKRLQSSAASKSERSCTSKGSKMSHSPLVEREETPSLVVSECLAAFSQRRN